jgi:hypothetical protein
LSGIFSGVQSFFNWGSGMDKNGRLLRIFPTIIEENYLMLTQTLVGVLGKIVVRRDFSRNIGDFFLLYVYVFCPDIPDFKRLSI